MRLRRVATRTRVQVLCALMLIGCGEDEAGCPPEHTLSADGRCQAPDGCPLGQFEDDNGTCVAPTCKPGEIEEGDKCVAAGLPSLACKPGAWLKDGSCVAAGVPADGCGDGFVHDGERACEAILPKKLCGEGMMATPGDTDCRPIGDCGAGKWGNIVDEPGTVYVDGSHLGPTSGIKSEPFTTIGAAITAVAPGGQIAVAAGTYPGPMAVTKPVRLRGRCAAMTTIDGAGVQSSVMIVTGSGAGTELRGLAIANGLFGLTIYADDVVASELWIHDATNGVVVSSKPSASLTLRDSLIERHGPMSQGVLVEWSATTLERVHIRDGVGLNSFGIFIRPRPNDGKPADVMIKQCHFERNVDQSVVSAGSDLTIDSTVIRDVQSTTPKGNAAALTAGRLAGSVGNVRIDRSVIDNARGWGIGSVGAVVEVSRTTIRRIYGTPMKGFDGESVEVGVAVTTAPFEGVPEPAEMTVVQSSIEAATTIGVLSLDSSLTLDRTVVANMAQESAATPATAIALQTAPAVTGVMVDTPTVIVDSVLESVTGAALYATNVPLLLERTHIRQVRALSSAVAFAVHVQGAKHESVFRHCLIEDIDGLGIVVVGASARIERSIIRSIHASSLGEQAAVAALFGLGTPPSLSMIGSVIENAPDNAIVVIGGSADIRGCSIDGIADQIGDGLAARSTEEAVAHITITDTRVMNAARAAIALWGARATLGNVDATCAAIDIDGESEGELDYHIAVTGPLVCGCGDVSRACEAVSAGLEAPQLLASPM